MHKAVIATGLALLAGAAWSFPADLEIRPKGLNIGAIVHSDGRVAFVRVTNQEADTLRCSAEFRNGPESGRTRHAIIESGDSTVLSWSPQREVVRLRIQLRCEPQGNGDTGADTDAEDPRDTKPRIVTPDDPDPPEDPPES